VSFITGEEDGSLAIGRMILHVVGSENVFVPQPEMPVEQAAFFLERIRNAAVDGVHNFNQASPTKRLVEEMADASVSFENGGQDLAQSFSRLHVGASIATASEYDAAR
jgi:hypothetical protein